MKITPNHIRRLLSPIVFGLVIATIVANVDRGVFAGWSIPLRESEIQSDAINGAKAATLATLAAMSFVVGIIPSSSDSIRLVSFQLYRSTYINICTAIATLGAGWFWLLDATDGDPVPFLVALTPSIGYGAIGYAFGSSVVGAWRADEAGQPFYHIRSIFNLALPYLIAAVVLLALYLLPSYIFTNSHSPHPSSYP